MFTGRAVNLADRARKRQFVTGINVLCVHLDQINEKKNVFKKNLFRLYEI